MSDDLMTNNLMDELSAADFKLEELEHAIAQERAMVDVLITVLEKYMDTVDPDENEWVAGNWQFRKRNMRSQYNELLASRKYLREELGL